MAKRVAGSWFGWFSTCLSALFAAWIILTLAETAHAAESNVFSNPAVTARLISAEDGVAPDAASVSIGLVLEYGEGWKGYPTQAGFF